MQTFLNKTKVNTKLSHIVVKYICILGIIFGKADAIMYNKCGYFRSLDLKNEFVVQVQQNKRKVLCVVVGSAQLTQEGTVEVSVMQTESETVDTSKVGVQNMLLQKILVI